jgi:hypothetical protein
MSWRAREVEPESKIPASQLKDLAFNIGGHAMVDGMTEQAIPEIICAYKQAGQYRLAVKEAMKKKEADPTSTKTIFQINAAYTDREKAEPEPGVKQYLVVGYTPQQPMPNLKTTISNKQQPVGCTRPDNKHIIPWNNKEIPVLVVTELLSQPPKGTQLYALIKPKNSLCTPHSIAQDFAFYGSKFRDNTTDKRSRGPNWNAKVTFFSVKPGVNSALLTDKQEKFWRARDSIKLVFDANISLANEIAFLAVDYHHTKEKWFLDEIQATLLAVESDINYRPLPENAGLRLFIKAEEAIDKEQSQQVVDDFLYLWPNTKHIGPKNVRLLHKTLLQEDVHLKYRFLKPFLMEACWVIGEKEVSKEDLGNMVKKLLGTLTCTLGTAKSTPSISTNDQNCLLSLLLAKLKEINQIGLKAKEQTKSTFGDNAFGTSSQDIWATFGDTTDTDTA